MDEKKPTKDEIDIKSDALESLIKQYMLASFRVKRRINAMLRDGIKEKTLPDEMPHNV